ncbi:metal-dependent hydrolase [Amycolatopsis antarctica]|uniref:Metal-dependent hydrolase n=1 Tax=Amycolatopsis antarctica TaxID=1854586 RepID=A0A263CY36_9PSEU|nr:endonuclease/exonuclease/phosphatase family protein [Amycolatopsis antarctica]OZM71064.1 metal-dependent hydrolase [Amycolatopsis antarctica]
MSPTRRVTTRLPVALGALLAVVLLAGASAGIPAVASWHPRALRVLGFNMHAGIGTDGRADLARTAAVIRDSGADVVGLQEVDVHWDARSGYADQARELAAMLGMRVFFAPIYDLDPEPGHTQRRRYGVAVLSRQPVTHTRNHHLTRQSTVDPGSVPGPAPGFAEVVVRVGGRSVHVYVTHLDSRPEPGVRAAQVAETVATLDGDGPRARQVLVGDLNAEPAAPELAPLLGRTADTWASAGTSGSGATFPADAPARRIDYVTIAGPVRALSATVPDVRASDHRPVLATVRVG